MLFKLFQSNAQQYEIYCGVLVPCASTITVQCRADGGTASTTWKWKMDPLNGEKFIKVAEVQGTEMKMDDFLV